MRISGNVIWKRPICLWWGSFLWKFTLEVQCCPRYTFAGLLCRVVWIVYSTRAPVLSINPFMLHLPIWRPHMQLCPLREEMSFSNSHQVLYDVVWPRSFGAVGPSVNNCAIHTHHGLCKEGWLVLGLGLPRVFSMWTCHHHAQLNQGVQFNIVKFVMGQKK